VWVALAAYATALVLAADAAGIWHRTALKETVYWFVGTAAVLTGNAMTERAFSREYARRLVRTALRFTIIVELLLNLYAMPLAAELVLVPLVGLFVLMQVVAERDPGLANVSSFLDRTLMLVGLGLITWLAVHAATDVGGLLTRGNAERLLLVPVFTVALLPFLFGVWWCSQWERVRIIRRWNEKEFAA
jgi:hypothetical protein